MSRKPRTPEYFPRMKHRAAKRRVVHVDIAANLTGFIDAIRNASEALAKMSGLPKAVGEK